MNDISYEEVILYSRKNPPCAFCTKAKNLLESNGVKYKDIEIGKDITRDQFMEKYPEIKSVPAIFFGNTYVGGYDQLEAKLDHG